MEKFKKRWEIQQNWKLIFPLLGILALAYSAYRLAYLCLKNFHIAFTILLSIVFYFVLLKITFFFFKKLEKKWVVNYKWEMIRIFIVFAITGTTASYIGKPILKFLNVTTESFSNFGYWSLRILILFIMYQVLLVAFGWLFGQFKFFWEFEKKMLKRLGLGRFVE